MLLVYKNDIKINMNKTKLSHWWWQHVYTYTDNIQQDNRCRMLKRNKALNNVLREILESKLTNSNSMFVQLFMYITFFDNVEKYCRWRHVRHYTNRRPQICKMCCLTKQWLSISLIWFWTPEKGSVMQHITHQRR